MDEVLEVIETVTVAVVSRDERGPRGHRNCDTAVLRYDEETLEANGTSRSSPTLRPPGRGPEPCAALAMAAAAELGLKRDEQSTPQHALQTPTLRAEPTYAARAPIL